MKLNNVYSNHAKPGFGTEFILNPKPHLRRLAGILPRLMLGLALLPLAASGQANYATPYTFTTIAGNPGYGSADGTNRAAQFAFPSSVAVDSAGNLYVADTANSTIREMVPVGNNWVVTTLAGLAGCTGTNDGMGSAARFSYPNGVAVDGEGNLYVADTANHTVRQLTPAGTNWVVTTLAGLPGSAGTNDGTGSAARFNNPGGVAVDSTGNIYVADTGNHTIRKAASAGTSWVVTTVAGRAGSYGSANGTTSAARFYFPFGLAVAPNGNLYVADSDNSAVRIVTPGGVVSTLANSFNGPYGVAVDNATNVYVTDTYNQVIDKVAFTRAVTTLAGSSGISGTNDGTGSIARFAYPCGVALDSAGTIYVADTANNTIRKMTPTGMVTTLAGRTDNAGSADGTGSAARFNGPTRLAVDTNGNVYVPDFYNHTVRKASPVGGDWVVTTLAGWAGSPGSADGTNSTARFNGPDGVALDGAGNLYVTDGYNDTVRKMTPVGTNWVVTTLAGRAGYSGSENGTNSAARFNGPDGVAVDSAGNLYLPDLYNNTIRKVSPVGTNWVVTTLAGAPGNAGAVDGTGSGARFNQPTGLALDNAGNLYVADMWNCTIRKITPVGANWVVTTIAGLARNLGSTDATNSAARFCYPIAVAVDSGTNLFVSSSGDNVMRKVTPVGANWVVTTIAGLAGYIANIDGTGCAARFNIQNGVAVDGVGNLYVSDCGNNTIRKGFPASSVPPPRLQPPSLSAGQFGFGITGLPGLPLNIEASSDLVNWQVMGTCCLSGGTNCVVCPNPNPGARFYRTQVR